jgi:predicted ATPase/class 3 adenylate cyclase
MTSLPSGTVTFLFTDIEGSTRLAREHAEIWESLRARHHQILREAIEANHGFVFQIIGDAFCAAFHKAGDALHAALKAQQDLQTLTWEDCVIRVRMGIHTGEAELHENEYQGYLTLSLVQRIMSAGHGGQILVSNLTENLLRGQISKDVSLRDMGEHTFKDVPYPVRVFQVIALDLQKEFPPLRVLDESPNNLPTQLTSFIGREKEIADVKRLLANTHLLTLIGPGGTGKTRLSLQVAADVLYAYPHGVWLIELAPISDPSSVPAAALAALDLPAEVHRPAIDMLCDYLREKEALLILDNCEHLVDSCAKMVDRLLHAAPKLRIMASSREALGIAGEVSYRVPSLELPDIKQLPSLDSLSQYEAVKLFIDRAQASQPTFNVTNENAPAVAQICHRLDGIPLALELAAAKVRALSVEQISKRLDDRFRLLTGGSRTALERHQTLRATLDWSYNLLPENEQLLFRRLSVFTNGWTLETAESVCSDELIHYEDVFDLLEQLVNKSLIIAEEWQSETRYRMLETMRQYAGEKLIEVGESEALRDKHLEYFLTLAETAEPHLIRTEQLEWLDRLEADHDNLRLALEWALGKESAEFVLRLCAALGMFWYIHCHWKEGARWLEKALARPSENASANEKIARARAFYQDAGLAHQLDDVKRGRASAEASLALSQETGQRRDLAIAQFYIAHANGRSGDEETANRLWEQSLTVFRDLQDLYWEAKTQFYFHATLDDLSQPAVDTLLVELARKAGERVLLAQTLGYKLTPLLLLGRMEEAEQHLAEIQMLYKEVGYVGGEELIYGGSIAHYRNNYSQARLMYLTCTERLELLGEKEMRSYAVHYLGLLARDEGDLHTAQTHLEEALEVARYFGTKHVIVLKLALLGQIFFLQGQAEIAKKHFAESLSFEVGHERSSHYLIPLILVCCLFVELIPSAAVKILACTTQQKPVRPEYLLIKRDFEKILAQAQTQLNESEFQVAWAEGENMTIDQAVDLALRTLDEI